MIPSEQNLYPTPGSGPKGLQAEIEILRSLIRRVSELRDEPQQALQQVDVMDGIGKACCRLATLMKAEKVLGATTNADLLNQALIELMDENPELFPSRSPSQPGLPGVLDGPV